MGKLTFRADDDLVDRVERLDASKSEVMREALRAYLEERQPGRERGAAPGVDLNPRAPGFLDAAIEARVDALIEERLGDRDVNLNISVEGNQARAAVPSDESDASTESDAPAREGECGQCGETIAPDHVYCPNCGEKRSRRVFCECGDELRTDWSFCPSCGRRTPAADVLDRS